MRQHTVYLAAFALIAAVAAAGLPAAADPPPDPISIDAHSPSTFLCAIPKNAADVYGVIGAIIGQGCDVGAPGPILHVPAPNYGLTNRDENDGHSAGERDPFARVAVYFSGDRASQGVPGTEYAVEENNLQAAGDRFVTNGFTTNSPAGAFAACAAAAIGPPVFPARPINLLSLNQDWYNEIPSIRPNLLNRLRYLDNLDAVELEQFDVNGDQRLDRPIYFTVDKVGPSFAGRPSDIFFTPFTGAAVQTFSTAPQIGLANPRDNVDAIAVWDVNANGKADAGLDYVVFSLDRGSPSLGGASAADLFVSSFTGTFCPFLRAASLGLERCDNVDAVDVEIDQVEVFEEPPIEQDPVEPQPVQP
jgi:hypothetical protein